MGAKVACMDHITANEVADKVAAAILRSGRSKNSVAIAAGFAGTTFNRKINGHVEFTFSEVLRIANVVGVPPSELIPAEFLARAAA